MRSLSILVLSLTIVVRKGEEIQLTIPGGDLEDGLYRLDYRPPVGRPQLSADGRVTFTGARAGTEYQFYLYYSNSSISDLLTRTFTTVTAPAPARDLTTKVARTAALVRWRPPGEGRFTGFRLRLVPVTPVVTGSSVFATNQSGMILTGLRAGATYRVEVLTVLEDKESLTFLSTLLTTTPHPPAALLLTSSSETSLEVLWQPPEVTSHFSHYKLSVEPPDAEDVVVAPDHKGPVSVVSPRLVPGRLYTVTVRTVSQDQESEALSTELRMGLARPTDLRVSGLEDGLVTVRWREPEGEFERYEVTLTGGSLEERMEVERGQVEVSWRLEQGRTYRMEVRTVAGRRTSSPASLSFSLSPRV